jgi:hypothetical protein
MSVCEKDDVTADSRERETMTRGERKADRQTERERKRSLRATAARESERTASIWISIENYPPIICMSRDMQVKL